MEISMRINRRNVVSVAFAGRGPSRRGPLKPAATPGQQLWPDSIIRPCNT
jgi:hypothetical protein